MMIKEDCISRRNVIKILGLSTINLGLLSACGGSIQGGKAQGTVTVWYYPFGDGVEQLYGQFAKEFEKDNPDIKINLQLQPWDNRNPKILSAIATHQGPDVFYITTDPLIRFAEANAIAPLDDLLPKDTWSSIVNSADETVSYRGSHWYLPLWQELPVWLYTPSLLEQIGWNPQQPPSTWDDLRMLTPAIAALGAIQFLNYWNEFLYPLVVTTDSSMRTVPVGLATLQTPTSGLLRC